MTPTNIQSMLSAFPLFSALEPSLLQTTVSGEHAHIISLSAGESPAPHFSEMLGAVLCGSLQILSTDTAHPILLRTASKGHIFGAASLFGKEHTSMSQLVAKDECVLFFLARDAVRNLLRSDAAFMDAYLQFLADRVQFLNVKIRSFTAGSAERRLVLWLAEHPEGIPFPVNSLSALAKMLDIGRASLYRALDTLEKEALISRRGREITIPSVEELLQKHRS